VTRFGVVQFPGSCDERDALLACATVPGTEATMLWHRDADLHDGMTTTLQRIKAAAETG